MRFNSLADWLGWLEQSHPKEIDLGLERIRQVAERLDLLKPRAKVVTVAGTNGKGSCVTATAGLLRAAGFTVGVYTSPHLLHYAERIQIHGAPVADELICAAFEQVAEASAEISLTYFEYGTLAALLIFKQAAVDFMVLEVGLGGRLDAVNIIDADVAVITPIAIDHQDWLGDNREDIGREKAGILRAQQYFVCADENPPQTILELAAQLNTNAHFINRDFFSNQYISSDASLNSNEASFWQWQGKTGSGETLLLPPMRAPHLPLPSMAAALQAIQFFNLELAPALIERELLALVLPGRFQKVVYKEREFIFDVAHNPAATEYFANRLKADAISGKTLALVAMMSDKDRAASLANLVQVVDEWYLLDLAELPRAATPAALTDNLLALQTQAQASGVIDNLMPLLLANASASASDRIIVFGSFFTVAAVQAFMQANP